MTHIGIGAVNRIQAVAAVDERFQLCFEGREFRTSRADVAELGGEKIADVEARHDTVPPHVEDGGDLDQGESRALSAADELQSGEDRVLVGAVAVRVTLRWGKQTPALVEADGLGIDAGGGGDFSDAHACDDTRLTLY